MARAQAHLAAGRHSEAIGAFRAVLGIDPSIVSARLGLADALAGRGQRDLAVDGLVEAAERCAEHEQHEQALALYGKALALAPSRTELCLDVAAVEHALGRTEAAVARVEALAERFMSLGRTEEAAELLRFATAWAEEVEEVEEVEAFEEFEVEEATVVARNPLLLPARTARPAPPAQTETVVCATVLVRPDGSLWLPEDASTETSEFDEAALTIARAVSAPLVVRKRKLEEADPDMVTRVAKPGAARAPARPVAARAPLAKPVVSPSAAAKPRVSQAPAAARSVGPAPAKVDAAPGSSPLVERLRKRAGLGSGETTAVPHDTKGKPTEPIVLRRPNLGRPDDDVTHRFRYPRASLGATAH